MKKTTKHYLEAIVIFILGGLGLYHTLTGWITGTLFFPSKYPSNYVSLTENSTGFYIALVLWVVMTVTILVWGGKNSERQIKIEFNREPARGTGSCPLRRKGYI